MIIKRAHIAAIHDVFMAALSFIFSLYLRYGSDLHIAYDLLLPSTLLFTCVCAFVFSYIGLYRGLWRYASVQDLSAITKAVTIATIVFIPLLFFITRLEDFPRSALIINWMVLIVFLGGPRFCYRVFRDRGLRVFHNTPSERKVPVLLLGVSDSSIQFIRTSHSSPHFGYRVVGIIDDDPKRKGRSIHTIKVLGNSHDIDTILDRLKHTKDSPQRIILGIEHPDGEAVRHILDITKSRGLSLAKLPNITEFKQDVDSSTIRPIAIEDLLGRPPKTPHIGVRKQLIKDQTILVTGAGGTIGSELVRQIATYAPKHIILLDHSEYNLYMIEKHLHQHHPKVPVDAVIGDVRDIKHLDHVFKTHTPQLVFHAAALKHVPLVEINLIEAVRTNIMGSKHVADLCLKHKARKMVMISTDKAVNPSSLMGLTKRIAECYVQSLGNTHTTFATVRFGNVLGSSGSVIPLFQSQLEQGGPITVTHPDMTRYFMSVPEAVELVLLASTIDQKKQERSSIYVLEMGDPINITQLAKQMILLAGLQPDKDIKIKYTGIREGEKLYEELFYENEEQAPTPYDDILHAKAKHLSHKEMQKHMDDIEKNLDSSHLKTLSKLLTSIVPQYHKP